MGMRAPVTGSAGMTREVPPPGKYLGICNGVYMLGTQPGYQNGPPELQIMLSFELHKRKGPAKNKEGRVFETSAIMKFSANVKSSLIRYASALENREYNDADLKTIAMAGGFDAEPLLGKVCWIDLANDRKPDGGWKDKIRSVTPLDPEDDKDLAEWVLLNQETDSIYWDWTKGVECPRRIKYFWDRAAENPNSNSESPLGGLVVDASTEVDGNGDKDVPF